MRAPVMLALVLRPIRGGAIVIDLANNDRWRWRVLVMAAMMMSRGGRRILMMRNLVMSGRFAGERRRHEMEQRDNGRQQGGQGGRSPSDAEPGPVFCCGHDALNNKVWRA